MGLFFEIVRALGASVNFSRVQYTVVDGGGGYFSNVKKLLAFSDRLIRLAGREGEVEIVGEGLRLARYCGGDLAVRGRILSVSRGGGEHGAV